MIPKIIHYIWVGGNEKPSLIKKCIESWKKFCPDYEIKCWNESNLDLNKYKFAKDAYDNKKWAYFSDVHRFDILNTYGGIYLDVDVELKKGLDQFLQYDYFTGFEDDVYVNPGLIMGCVPNHKVCNDVLNIYKDKEFDIDNLRDFTVCKITTKYLCDNYNMLNNGATQNLDDNIMIFSKDYFCPKNYISKEVKYTKNTVSIHHYYGSWLPKQKFFTRLKNNIKSLVKKILGKKNVNKIREKRKQKREQSTNE